jgi:hypothetical protein
VHSYTKERAHAGLHALGIELIHAIGAAQQTLHPEPVRNAQQSAHIPRIGDAIQRKDQFA